MTQTRERGGGGGRGRERERERLREGEVEREGEREPSSHRGCVWTPDCHTWPCPYTALSSVTVAESSPPQQPGESRVQ